MEFRILRYSFAVAGSILMIFSGIALGDTSMDRILPACYLEDADATLCGTPAILEAYRLSGETDSPLANRPVLSGPEYTFNSAGGYFKIHWTDSGADSVSLEYANSIALAADSSWHPGRREYYSFRCSSMN